MSLIGWCKGDANPSLGLKSGWVFFGLMVPMCFAVYFVSLKSLRLTPANPSSCPTSPVDRHPSWTSSGRPGFLLGSSTRPRRRFRTISKTAWSRRRLLGVANRGGARCGWGRTGRELNFAMPVRDVRLCQCKDASILQYLVEARLSQRDQFGVGCFASVNYQAPVHE